MTVPNPFRGFLKAFLFLLAVCSLGLPFLAKSSNAQEDAWLLVRAEYGFRDQRNDVTDLLRNLLARGGVNGRIIVNNQVMGGDPAVGRDKTLHIVARNRRGEQREFSYREGSFLDVTMFAPPASPRDDWADRDRDHDQDRDHDRDRDRDRDLYIIRAYYGIQGRTANVTELLRQRMREGLLTLDVNNYNLGGDPAIGADKVLIVIYRFHGEEQATAVREGFRLTIP